MTKKGHIVVHVPHSSLYIPREYLGSYLINDMGAEQLKMTDMYCDELFYKGDDTVVFSYSRLLCDVERFREDADEEMSGVGMGLAYTKTSDGRALREVSPRLRNELLCRYYDPHHAALTAAVDEKLSSCGKCLIVDGHSFHPRALPYERYGQSERPDFCIGTDSYHTPKEIESICRDHLQSEGFSVAINSPFAGTMVPLKYYRSSKSVSSVMIEINRRLYMDENGEKTKDFERIGELIAKLYPMLEESVR